MILNKIIIDTCVIVSGVKSRNGASYKILSNINKSIFRYGLSVALYLEYEAKLLEFSKTDLISLNKKEVETILSALVFYSNNVPIYYKIRPNLKDENDNMVYECAVNFGADFIVTHNVKDFKGGDLKPYSVSIITPQEFLAKERLI
ncbi:MAG: putative toxin-antitoxin system toxin component, PIN family [Spirochaetes bacterium]|nr:putative toxin-antitoxin system toxin component, PIN family [Spirochaetota bacterium]